METQYQLRIRGFTLIELLIALALMAAVIAQVLMVFAVQLKVSVNQDRLLDIQQYSRGALMEGPPGLRQGQAAGAAVEQAGAEPALQIVDAPGHRRGRMPHAATGFGKRSGLDHGPLVGALRARPHP